jgi:hypothetical protein
VVHFSEDDEGPDVELPRLLLKLGPTDLFDLCPFTVRARYAVRLSGPFLPPSMYSHPCDCNFMPHLLLSSRDYLFRTLALSLSLLLLSFVLICSKQWWVSTL